MKRTTVINLDLKFEEIQIKHFLKVLYTSLYRLELYLTRQIQARIKTSKLDIYANRVERNQNEVNCTFKKKKVGRIIAPTLEGH